MCDDATEAENEAYLELGRLNRREVNIGVGASLAALFTGCASAGRTKQPETRPTTAMPKSERAVPQTASQEKAQLTSESAEKAAPFETTSRWVNIATAEGAAEAFFVTPARGKYPGVLLWPDVAGLRDAYVKMATRLAGAGYAVLVVNPYYRSAKLPLLSTFSEWKTSEGKAKIQPLRDALTPEGTTRDGAAFAHWLDQQSGVDQGKKLAVTGYCMGGPFTFRTAAVKPERVGVIASFHGGGLVTAEPTSPHLLLPALKAAALICIAQNDDERDPAAKSTLQEAADAAHVPAEIEVYPAQHGWCTVDSPVYDEVQAERAWARMLATFERFL